MNRSWTFIMILVLVIILIATCACEPGVPAVVNPPTYPAQTEETVEFQGNSVSWNVFYDAGLPQFFDEGDFSPGALVDRSWTGEPATQRLPRAIAEGNADRVVWDLGLNEIFVDPNKQWALNHQLMWFDLLAQKTPPTSCIVMVKQWVLPLDYPNRPLASLNAQRVWTDEFAATHPNVVVVDWKPILEANPHFSQKDGVHIDPNTGGAQARHNMYLEGLSRCA